MKETFIDPETGWTVSRETRDKNIEGVAWIVETVTDPETGETLERTRRADVEAADIATWIREVRKAQEYHLGAERQRSEAVRRRYPELARGAEIPDGPLGIIKLRFAEGFAHWGISLPDEAVEKRQRGKICAAGWAIWYLFGSDETGEYLDFYSAHRMTNDDHVRIYEDGRVESLPAIADMRLCSEDPEEDARLKREQHAEDLRIMALLEAKGFGIAGDEPGAVQIQRYQRTQDPEK